MDYLAELLKEKKQLAMFPNFFPHMSRLLDEEIVRTRSAVFKCEFNSDSLKLPDPEGDKVQLTEKVFVPIKEHPDYNFVGRILGPRGMTAKQLEQETGCKIMIRGKGSLRDQAKEDFNHGKPNFEHLNDELHVLIQCDDSKERAALKMENAVAQIKKLLVLPATQGIDELKRKQLMELSIINGTYRSPCLKYPLPSTPRLDHSGMSCSLPFSPGFIPSLPAFFESPLPSPMNSNNSSSPSFSDLRGGKPCSVQPLSKEAFDFNLNLVMKAMGEHSLNPSGKKNPLQQETWRSGSNSSGDGFQNGSFNGGAGDAAGKLGHSPNGYAGGTLICSGCGAVERA